jgi:hypothetical protein
MHKFPGTLRGPQDRECGALLTGFWSSGGDDGHRF